MNKTESAWCPRCNKLVPVKQPRTNHTLHLVLTVLTCGLWLPVWITLAMRQDDEWLCTECGRVIKHRKGKGAQKNRAA